MNNNENLFGEYAGFLSRASAFITDLVIEAVILLVVNWFVATMMLQFTGMEIDACAPLQPFTFGAFTCHIVRLSMLIFTLFFAPLYYFFFWILSGQTPGKYLFGLRIVRLNGHRMNLLNSLIRYAGYFLGVLTLGLGFLNVLISDRRQGWHDKLAGTCVVYAWEARQNETFLQQMRKRFQKKTAADSTPELPANVS
jgi:uncharacterized RDD family membrane protein YckC